MKILIMNPILYTAETDNIPKVSSIKDTMIYALCEGFIQNGDEPVLIAAMEYKPESEETYPFPIIWMPCVFRKIFKPRCLPYLEGLGKYLKKHAQEYDYIISSEVFSMLTLCAALYAREKLVIWHELGAHNNILKKIPSKVWYHVIARIFFRDIPIIPRSEKARQFISRFCNNVLDTTIDHGVDLDKINFSREKDNFFVVVSQLIGRKHIDGIIQHFVDFNVRRGNSFKLKIIGDGVLKEKLIQQVNELNMQESVSFYGKLSHSELVPILAKAKAMLINTSKDNSMVSITESIAAGTPVITTSVPFNADYIKAEKLGIVKDDWTKDDLEEICNNNEMYINNCIQYRQKLSNQYMAKEFNIVGSFLAGK